MTSILSSILKKFFSKMTKEQRVSIFKENFKFQISKFLWNFQILKKEKKFKEPQESIKVFILKRKFKSKKKRKKEDHTSQNSGTTKHSSFKV